MAKTHWSSCSPRHIAGQINHSCVDYRAIWQCSVPSRWAEQYGMVKEDRRHSKTFYFFTLFYCCMFQGENLSDDLKMQVEVMKLNSDISYCMQSKRSIVFFHLGEPLKVLCKALTTQRDLRNIFFKVCCMCMPVKTYEHSLVVIFWNILSYRCHARVSGRHSAIFV